MNYRRNFIKGFLAALAGVGLLSAVWPVLAVADSPSATEADWGKLTEQQRNDMLQRWQAYKALPQKDKEELDLALAQYNQMSPTERAELEKNYSTWRGLSEEEKAKVKERYQQWAALPDSAKSALREKSQNWDRMTDEEKKNALKGAFPDGKSAK